MLFLNRFYNTIYKRIKVSRNLITINYYKIKQRERMFKYYNYIVFQYIYNSLIQEKDKIVDK